jgi:hypothetical protein
MIKYALRCKDGHQFDAWFASSAAYDKLAAAGQVACTNCGSADVSKALMAPSIVSGRSAPERTPVATAEPVHREAVELMRKLKAFVEQNSENVGPRFAEEALKIHYQEAEPRGIRGEASESELRTLHEEGVEFYPLPVMPEEHN